MRTVIIQHGNIVQAVSVPSRLARVDERAWTDIVGSRTGIGTTFRAIGGYAHETKVVSVSVPFTLHEVASQRSWRIRLIRVHCDRSTYVDVSVFVVLVHPSTQFQSGLNLETHLLRILNREPVVLEPLGVLPVTGPCELQFTVTYFRDDTFRIRYVEVELEDTGPAPPPPPLTITQCVVTVVPGAAIMTTQGLTALGMRLGIDALRDPDPGFIYSNSGRDQGFLIPLIFGPGNSVLPRNFTVAMGPVEIDVLSQTAGTFTAAGDVNFPVGLRVRTALGQPRGGAMVTTGAVGFLNGSGFGGFAIQTDSTIGLAFQSVIRLLDIPVQVAFQCNGPITPNPLA